MPLTACPPEDRLRLLLGGSASQLDPAEHADLIAHLDKCPPCQHRLEQLADATLHLLGVARRVGQNQFATDEDSLRRVLAGLQESGTQTVSLPRRGSDGATLPAQPSVPIPTSLGMRDGYQIDGLLGQGAMGQVLAGFDPALQRRIAIKVLAPNLAGDPVARERFAREARAAAAVKHRHVVTIHAVREDDGLPYLVMEHLAGGSLQDYLSQYGMPGWQNAVRLGAEIAEGLAAAHDAGLIHRDIKPSNILLDSVGPGQPGTAKIGDFGLARIADESRLTESGILAGTPMYMAPEQALGEPLDERADLFSLGSLLYILCTGREPFTGGNPMAVLRQVCETTPVPVRQLNPHVPVWFADLIAQLHAKRPADRPASAAVVASLLRHNLTNPEQPRFLPRTSSARAHRQKIRLLAVLAIAALLLAGLVFAISNHGSEPDPTSSADQGDDGLTLRTTLRGHTGPVWAAAFSLDGATLVTGSDDTTLRFWDVRAGQPSAIISGQRGAVLSVLFANQGKDIVAGRGDGTLQVWDFASRQLQPGFPHTGGNARRVGISPDGKTLAVGSSTQGVELWDIATRHLQRELPGHPTTLLTLAFAPDGKTLATGDASGEVRLWDTSIGTERDAFAGDTLGLRALAFSPDGKTLATAGTGERNVKLWNVSTHKEIATLEGHDDVVLKLAFSPHGHRLATGSRDGKVRLWNVHSGQTLAQVAAHKGSVWSIEFSPDGRILATVGEDRLVKLWDMRASTSGK